MMPAVHGRPVPSKPQSRARLIAACWAGREPAELLDPRERELLLFELWQDRWTDAEIAQHTSMTLYTTCRIRERLGLSARRSTKGAAA